MSESRRRGGLAVIFVALGIGCATPARRPASPDTLVIRDVTVIDTVAGERLAHRDVHVRNDRIVAVRPAGDRSSGAVEIDGRGRFLIPGLWDMHAHWDHEPSLPLFTLSGVTGLRVMQTYSSHYAWRQRGIEGTPASPRLYLATPLVDGRPASTPASIEIATPDEARRAVRTVAGSRADFLKVYDKVPREAYLALLDEARRRGVRVEGHVPVEVSWQEAADLGVQRSFEHFHSMAPWVSSRADALHPRWLAYNRGVDLGKGLTSEQRLEYAAIHHEAYDHFDPARFAALARTLREKEVFQAPTCVLWRARRLKLDPAADQDPRMKRVPPGLRQFWNGWWPKDERVVRLDFEVNARRDAFCLARTKDLFDAGAPLLAGSDVIMPYVFPGTSLHEELALMVEAGIPAPAALKTATANVGRFLGREDVGVIREGALADLVLLEADPLQDIENVGRIHGVVAGGRWIGPEERRAGFARIERIIAAPAAAGELAGVSSAQGLDAALRRYSELCPAAPETRDCSGYDVVSSMGGALAQSAEKDRAGDLAAWAVEHLASDADALYWAADHYQSTAQPAKALAALDQVLTVAPGDPLALHMRERLANTR